MSSSRDAARAFTISGLKRLQVSGKREGRFSVLFGSIRPIGGVRENFSMKGGGRETLCSQCRIAGSPISSVLG